MEPDEGPPAELPLPTALIPLFVRAGLNSRWCGPQRTQLSFSSGLGTFVNTCPLGQQEVPWDTGKGRRISFDMVFEQRGLGMVRDLYRHSLTHKSTTPILKAVESLPTSLVHISGPAIFLLDYLQNTLASSEETFP